VIRAIAVDEGECAARVIADLADLAALPLDEARRRLEEAGSNVEAVLAAERRA